MDMSQYRIDILTSFNEQFAQNQNNHQNLFIQVVSILLTVVLGFGFALSVFGGSATDKGYKIELLEFSVAFCAAESILLLGISLVSNMALGFRRDQLVNAVIREKARVTEDTATEGRWRIFPASYNPAKGYTQRRNNKERFLCLTWMPNFHVAFTSSLFGFQILIIGAYFAKLIKLDLLLNGQRLDTSSFLFGLVGCLLASSSLFVVTKYHERVVKYYAAYLDAKHG